MITLALMRAGMIGMQITSGSRLLCGVSIVSCLLLSACGGSSSDSGSTVSTERGQMQGLLTRLWTETGSQGGSPVTPIRFPMDLSPHPDAATESFQLQAILTGEDGAMMSVQAQLDRLSLGIEAIASSEWGFTDILRSSVVFGTSDQPTLRARETLERRALGLADSDLRSIHVNDTRLALQTQMVDQGDLTPAGECKVRYQFTSAFTSTENVPNGLLSLEFDVPTCPETLSILGLNRWQASALATTGTLGSTGTETIAADEAHWQGHVWLSQMWGNVPPAGGAVLIDQVNLRLTSDAEAGLRIMSASRSKRKTGRGPQSVQATISTLADDERPLSLTWIDEGEQTAQVSGIVYPQRFRLRNQDNSIDLLLTPMVALPEISDSLGVRWSGAVIVSGTHKGTGFMVFQPVSGGGQK